jgi:hypothetical protein
MQAESVIVLLVVLVTVLGVTLLAVARISGQYKEYQTLYREYLKKREQVRSRRGVEVNNGS